MGKEEDKRVNDMKGSRRDDDVTVTLRDRVCTATVTQSPNFCLCPLPRLCLFDLKILRICSCKSLLVFRILQIR